MSYYRSEGRKYDQSEDVVLSTRTKLTDQFSMQALIAQRVEHMTGNQRVMGCVIY